jgi:hypothetical protein
VWGYGTVDALEEVLRPGYFAGAGTLLRPGELIYVSARRRNRAAGPARDPRPGDIHMALVMVARAAERGGARSGPSVRLVQDFGCPEASPSRPRPWPRRCTRRPSSTAAPARPAGRNRKNGALPTLLVN